MRFLGLNEIREKYLSFFESKDHLRLPSFPLVPINDKSVLLINAGMTPLKPYFTGQETPPKKRVTTCQKCIRTPDIECVGKTARHGTFFEMLGNFSFGDYFKKEVIPWAWEFLTVTMEIPADKLWITIYDDDDEAFEIWNKSVGIPAERIVRLGKEENFWEHGNIKEDEFTIDRPIGRSQKDRKKMAVTEVHSKEAVTHFRVIERFTRYTLVRCQLETGRTHQIRVHMASAGHPVVGDKTYGVKNEEFSLKGQLLHACLLGFIHPKDGQYMEFTSQLPPYYKKVLEVLGKRVLKDF